MTKDESIRTGLSPKAIQQDILDNLYLIQGRIPKTASRHDWYMAVAYSVRDRILNKWMETIDSLLHSDKKVVSYLSAEFLMGPQLGCNLLNLGIMDEVKEAVKNLGQDLDKLIEDEQEPGLGNGGLGRLAACYLDSLASLEYMGVGYGIRYEFGIFKQTIKDGWQVELADNWLHLGNPWEVIRPEVAFNVGFGGHTEHIHENGRDVVKWIPERTVRGVACDVAVPGYHVNTVNLLRLWKADATENFDFQAFNAGEYWKAVEDKVDSENITKVLYPNDEAIRGKRLRLEQQVFFVSCSLQDMIRVSEMRNHDLHKFEETYAIQLNDTHPSIAIAELMRLLIDEHAMEWDTAWKITQKSFAYTNHTLLPEALEKWSLGMFQSLLPRHLEIIYEINHRFLSSIKDKVDEEAIRRMSIIDESGEKYVRMANLATIGSFAVNGVAELHTQLLKKDVLHDFYDLDPVKFLNVTNGVTPRRWVMLSNPHLSELITQTIGEGWIYDMEKNLPKLEPYANDLMFQEKWEKIKFENKKRLAEDIKERTGIIVDPHSLFDIQVKRIHEYKRQHLNILHVITSYMNIKKDPKAFVVPRTVIFGGKSAPGYHMAKLIIKLINSVAEVVNNDSDVNGRLKVVFIPDFNVKHAHAIYPAADLSEQISTAGKEASGTGNMKFSMNGALTIGTLDGANIEIRNAVGADNFFLFGLSSQEVKDLKLKGYNPRAYIDNDPQLRGVLDLIDHGKFGSLFRELVDSLVYRDEYMLLADYASYIECQKRVDKAFQNTSEWSKKSILNVARIGIFSSDRSIRDYAKKIWKVYPNT